MDSSSPMYIGINHLHSSLRWVILALLIVLLVKAFSGRSGGKAFTPQDRKMTLWLTIASHIQLVIGFFQYFVGNWGFKMFQNLGGGVMKNSMARFFAVEHLAGMLIAIVLITIAGAYTKKDVTDQAKWSKLFTFYLIALVVMILSIPWAFREVGMGRGWI